MVGKEARPKVFNAAQKALNMDVFGEGKIVPSSLDNCIG